MRALIRFWTEVSAEKQEPPSKHRHHVRWPGRATFSSAQVSVDDNINEQAIFEEFKRTRNLILFLVRHEIDRLMLWHNPSASVWCIIRIFAVSCHAACSRRLYSRAWRRCKSRPRRTQCRRRARLQITRTMQLRSFRDRWREYARVAWEIDPRLAVYLTTRFAGNEILREHVMLFVLKQPELVADVVRL